MRLILIPPHRMPMETNSTLVIFVIVTALDLVMVVAVDIIFTAQEAEAKGCRTSVAVNASNEDVSNHS